MKVKHGILPWKIEVVDSMADEEVLDIGLILMLTLSGAL